MCDQTVLEAITNGKLDRLNSNIDSQTHLYEFGEFFDITPNLDDLTKKVKLVVDNKSINLSDDNKRLKDFIKSKFNVEINFSPENQFYSGTRRYIYDLISHVADEEQLKKKLQPFSHIIKF